MWNDETTTFTQGGRIEIWKRWLPSERKCKTAEDKRTLDVAKKDEYAAALAAQESKLQVFTADPQSETGRNC